MREEQEAEVRGKEAQGETRGRNNATDESADPIAVPVSQETADMSCNKVTRNHQFPGGKRVSQ